MNQPPRKKGTNYCNPAIATTSYFVLSTFFVRRPDRVKKYSTFKVNDKKETEKAGIKAIAHLRSRFFVSASILLKCFP